MDKEKNSKVEELAGLILTGQSTVSELGTACKSMQTGMAVSMLAGLNEITKAISKSTHLLDIVNSKIQTKIAAELEADLIETDDLISISERLVRTQISLIDLQRKIVQGKELIPETTLSDEEKVVVRLFKSFKTREEKEKFIGIVNAAMKDKEDFDLP